MPDIDLDDKSLQELKEMHSKLEEELIKVSQQRMRKLIEKSIEDCSQETQEEVSDKLEEFLETRDQ